MKIIRRILVWSIIISIFSILVACGNTQNPTGTMRVVIATENPVEYTVDLDEVEIDKGGLSILEHLKETKGLEFTAQSSSCGDYLTKVGALEENALEQRYIYVYTSVSKDFDVSTYATTIEYDGVSLTSSGVGISDMTIENNCIIYFSTIIY